MSRGKGLGLKGWLTGPGKREAAEVGPEEPVHRDKHRVAVLPFANISPDTADEYFADGMTEEVISTLSRVPEVEVISRTSVMHYKKDPKPIKEVSKELDVGTVLEGSIRKAGNKLRITVQMIDAARERPIWADSYDRELQDVFAIQSEVASRVARALLIKQYDSEATSRKDPTTNPEAYALYLKGRYFWNKRGLENTKKAISHFEQAVTLDPRFALGFVGLADSYEVLADNQTDAETNHEKARATIAKAVELDPELAEAKATKGLILLSDYKPKDAEKEFKKSLTLNPNYAPAHLWYYHLLWAELRWSEALEQIQRAVSLDPLSPNMYTNLAHYYYAKGDYRTALEMCKRAAGLDPGFAHAHEFAGQAYGKLKLFDEARQEFDGLIELSREAHPVIGKTVEIWLAYLKSDKEGVRKLLPVVESDPGAADLDALEIAGFHFFLEDIDGGFDWLEQGYFRKDYSLTLIQSNVGIPDTIRIDPRYLSLVKKLGLI